MGNLEDAGKQSYFEEQGYEWDPRIKCYVNKDKWKIFAKDYIDDHSFDQLLADFEQPVNPGQWQYYFNTESESDIHNVRKHYGVVVGEPVK